MIKNNYWGGRAVFNNNRPFRGGEAWKKGLTKKAANRIWF
jgi:hypothetical protein